MDDWDEHWSEYREASEANPAQLYRRQLVLSLLGPGVRNLVDIGCGQGDLARDIHAVIPTAQILGLELSQTGIRLAKLKVPSATFQQRDLLKPAPLATEYRHWATHAVCSEVLEHVDHPEVLLRNAFHYLADGCRLVITVPGGPMSAYDRHIGHRTHYRPEQLQRVLTDAGLTRVRVTRAGFPFFNIYRLAVLARGEKLVSDARRGIPTSSQRLTRMFASTLRWLFAFNQASSRWGWQIVATANLARHQ
jgi:trans-aconitate methyltransferase